MKPKDRFYGYGHLAPTGYGNGSVARKEEEEEAPMDLSVKSQAHPVQHSVPDLPLVLSEDPREGSQQGPSPSLLYYYCLLNEQSMASRAAVAAAMADTYSKLNEKVNQTSPISEFGDNLVQRYREESFPKDLKPEEKFYSYGHMMPPAYRNGAAVIPNKKEDEEEEDDDENEDDDQLGLDLSVKRQPNGASHQRSLPSLPSSPPEDGPPQFPSSHSLFYYYCLLNEQSMGPRAAVAAAMADAYSIINEKVNQTSPINSEFGDSLGQRYHREEHSPEHYNGRTELRSADTTNGLEANGERKRISRPLTGRHVRHGTGASPSTLLTLRNMLRERQRLKESGATGHKLQGKNKGTRKKRK